ncbi:hypothetical protein BN946_scf184592.g11 [Trametes cinnabarina]|uniref:Uncharacterized protein n=1 Tax=Pycnoporus cinnabarinus TaxID=5643 RepID=A0A060SRV0_PYCCI|nr:hypothetical protein BN946_scf184592.g11 [Trametes cinnabarina]
MSGIPPQIDTTQPGTPAGEWARSTTTAAFARTEHAPALSASTNPTHVEPTSAGISVSAANDAQKPPFDAKAFNMAPPTPGSEFPGAYPVTPGEQAAKPNIPVSTETIKDTAQSAAETASKVVQSAAETAAQYLPQGVIDTFSAYMPATSATPTMSSARASEHDTEHTTSLPSKEVTGASPGEHTAGVGSLPGFVTESSVSKLPDERVDSERYTTAAGAAATLAASAYAVKETVSGVLPSTQDAQATKEAASQKAQQTKEAAKQTARQTAEAVKQTVPGTLGAHSTAVTASTVPSRELFGAQPGDHSSGAGALPGFVDEPHVARLPEESAHPQYNSGEVDAAAQVSLKPSEETTGNEVAVGEMRHVGGAGALVGGRDESSVALLPDERAGKTASSVIGGASRTVPSQEPQGNEAPGAHKHVGGVGALVGSREEQGVAVLPDEHVQQKGTGTGTVTQAQDKAPSHDNKQASAREAQKPSPTTSDKIQTGGQDGLPKKGHHSLPGDPGTGRFAESRDRNEQYRPRDTQANPLHATLQPRAHALGAERAQWGPVSLNGDAARHERDSDFDGPAGGRSREGDGYDTDYHPAALHPPPEKLKNPASEGEKSLGATQADANRPPEESQPPNQARDEHGDKERKKKAGFMEKMKGEAKVLLGKIEGKPEKVEQGQKIKSGEA